MTNATVRADRLSATRRHRTPLAVVGAAVLGLSLLLSVAPALGAANNGNGNGSNGNDSSGGTHGTSGNVKVHDAGTGVETTGTDNEPHVCAFWLRFTFDAPFEAGTWVVVSWAPTGDGSTIASGTYDTAGDGMDNSSVIEVAAGHYRVEWAAAGATSSKKKTFWVDASCFDEPVTEESQVEDVTPPTDAPGSPAEESQVEDVTPPTDAPGSPAEESQVDELVLADEETAPQEDEAPAEDAPATDEEDVAPVEEPVIDDVTSPDDEGAPTDADEPAQAADPGATDPGTPPAQDELGSISGSDQPPMSDTATAPARPPNGLIATVGVLMLIAGCATTRRDRRSEREIAA